MKSLSRSDVATLLFIQEILTLDGWSGSKHTLKIKITSCTKRITNLGPSAAFSQKFTAFLKHVACPHDYPYSEVHSQVLLYCVPYSAFNTHSSSCVVKYNLKPSILSLLAWN